MPSRDKTNSSCETEGESESNCVWCNTYIWVLPIILCSPSHSLKLYFHFPLSILLSVLAQYECVEAFDTTIYTQTLTDQFHWNIVTFSFYFCPTLLIYTHAKLWTDDCKHPNRRSITNCFHTRCYLNNNTLGELQCTCKQHCMFSWQCWKAKCPCHLFAAGLLKPLLYP